MNFLSGGKTGSNKDVVGLEVVVVVKLVLDVVVYGGRLGGLKRMRLNSGVHPLLWLFAVFREALKGGIGFWSSSTELREVGGKTKSERLSVQLSALCTTHVDGRLIFLSQRKTTTWRLYASSAGESTAPAAERLLPHACKKQKAAAAVADICAVGWRPFLRLLFLLLHVPFFDWTDIVSVAFCIISPETKELDGRKKIY